MYNNDVHNSMKISYKPNNLATMNIDKNIIVLTSTEENHLNIHDSSLEVELNVSTNAID